VTHTSGITRTKSEILKYKGFEILEVDDFLEPKSIDSNLYSIISSKFLKYVHGLLYKTLEICGILSTCNTDTELYGLKPWVIEIRGHYTRFKLDEVNLLFLYNEIKKNAKPFNNELSDLGIQYRLGDLVSLESKNPIPAEKIIGCISRIQEPAISSIELHSDSPALAHDLLSSQIRHSAELKLIEIQADQIILRLVEIPIFIGTSAKISVWVAILRVAIFAKTHTYMPVQFRGEFESHGIMEGVSYF
jgi:hypothetical protein